MIVTFEREPFGWVHPFYRHQTRRHLANDWDSFVRPALETVNTLNHMLHLANCMEHEPGLIRSQRGEKQNDKFEIKMDVQQFSPEELDVKMVDNCVVVEGKHEEKQDEHGFISRHFVRRYQLPDDVKAETVTCNLSSDGVLCITAPRMIEEKPANERVVPINFTGQPAVKDQAQKQPQQEAVAQKKVEGMDVTPSEATTAA